MPRPDEALYNPTESVPPLLGDRGQSVWRDGHRRLLDSLQNGGEVFQHLLVPEANHSVAVRLEAGGADVVPLALCWPVVDFTVQFNHELPSGAIEVQDQRPHGMLSAKLQPGEPTPAKGLP